MAEGRTRLNFDWDWKFQGGDPAGAERTDYDDGSWRPVRLPHDWSIEGPFDEGHPTGGDGGYLPAGSGWYRKTFVPPAAEGRQCAVQFDGVYMNSEVWINGRSLGTYPYGYTSFRYDLTPYLIPGEANVLAVRVDNSAQPNSRWYTGSGIYRHVWLELTDPLHIAPWGLFVTTPDANGDRARIAVETELRNDYPTARTAVLRHAVLDPNGREAAAMEASASVRGAATATVRLQADVDHPRLWSDASPDLYTLQTTIWVDGSLADSQTTAFGIRTVEFDADRGFLLNDRQVKLNGVCLHHDGGCVGAAVPERVWERRLETLREMGCNAIRMSHNPPAPELLDLCDRMGFLVMDEAFDEWRIAKDKNGIDVFGYYTYFEEWAERDLAAMIRRDRNHPSIVLWSIGNEIREQTQPDGHLVARKLLQLCEREDPTRLVTAACDNIESEPRAATEAFLNELDVVGYNYVNRWRTRTETHYAEDRHRYPRRRIIGSENIGLGGVRGDYALKPASGSRWSAPYYARMIDTEQLWRFTRMHDYVAGDFMWTGIDYLGETKWPNKNASSGVIDLCGFPKDGYYFYQSQWKREPMLHLMPHWNWRGREGTVIPVVCYTNCDSAELWLNGRSFGVKCKEFPRQGMTQRYGHYDKPVLQVTTADLHLAWDVPYEPGTLKVAGYRDGEKVCEREIRTTGIPAAVRVKADRRQIRADGYDVCHLAVEVVDEDGRVVPTADSELKFRVDGDGVLLGTDNGRPDCREDFRSPVKAAFHGLALGIVQSTRQAGEIRITVESPDLASDGVAVLTQ